MTRRPAFPLPDALLEGDIAILGKKGGGKTVTGKNVVERLLDLQHRVLVLDVLGVWAGLRTSADGKKPGYPVAIFGGDYGDLPLDPGGAAALAAVLGTENLPAVIDLSEMSKAEQNRFVGAFLDELRRVNRHALTLVLEEADVFAPQNPLGDDSKKVHAAIDWIARRGRFRGFRLVTITQRPARLSKDVLTQASTLIMHRLPSPQDRDAARAWVDGNGDRDQAKVVFDTLASLDVGEAWVYAQDPAMLERVRFPIMKTLDTSSTPKAGETRIQQKTLAQVDVAALRASLTAVASVKSKKAGATNAADIDVATLTSVAEQRGFDLGVQEGFRRGIARGRDLVMAVAEQLAVPVAEAKAAVPAEPGRSAATVKTTQPKTERLAVAREAIAAVDAGLTRPQGELLSGLRWWRDAGHEAVTRAQLAAVVGWKVKGSHLRNRMAELRTGGLLTYPTSGTIALTEAGMAIAPPPSSEADLHTHLCASLTSPQKLMFDALLKQGGEMSRRSLAAELRWDESGSHLRNRLSELKAMEIATYPSNGRVALQGWVTAGA